jgi:hypothetical protein
MAWRLRSVRLLYCVLVEFRSLTRSERRVVGSVGWLLSLPFPAYFTQFLRVFSLVLFWSNAVRCIQFRCLQSIIWEQNRNHQKSACRNFGVGRNSVDRRKFLFPIWGFNRDSFDVLPVCNRNTDYAISSSKKFSSHANYNDLKIIQQRFSVQENK